MKRIYQYACGLVLTSMLSLLMVGTASAQRGGHSGGGGGGGVGFHGTSGVSTGIRSGTGVRTGTGYRGSGSYGVSAVRSGRGYFAGVGYRAGAFYRPGFGYYGYPHIGFYLGFLPFGYYPFYWGAGLYYYYDGIFYCPYDNGGYQVVTPPLGAAVPTLPEGATAIKIDGIQYYEASGVYYKETTDDKGKVMYVVAGRDGVLDTSDSATDPNASVATPKVGDLVNQLPDDCHKVILNGKRYFVSPDGIYYEKVTDPNGNPAFRIISLPEPEDDKGA
ncbi:MAG TPA: DUF6515 family protein [Mucilaginibacter sp.]|nr:DUF6515 family protein [Mucilaginibacter sp.]